MSDDDLIKDGEIRESFGYWYAIYEFQNPLSEDQIKVAKRALLYKFMQFLENSSETGFVHKIIVHPDFRQVSDLLGRTQLLSPSIAITIEKRQND